MMSYLFAYSNMTFEFLSLPPIYSSLTWLFHFLTPTGWTARVEFTLACFVFFWMFRRGIQPLIHNGVIFNSRKLLSWFITRKEYECCRRKFRNLKPKYRQLSKGNPHKHLACFRDSATHQMNDFCESVGYPAYHISLATRYVNDRDNNMIMTTTETDDHTLWSCRFKFRGNRVPFSIADTGVPSIIDDIQPNDSFVFTDVDYYVDLNYYAAYMQPMMIYTFDPIDPAGTTNEMTWTIVNDEFVVRIHGGGEFKHPVWNHSQDIATFHYGLRTYNYKCDRIRYDDYHSLLYYTPLSSYLTIFDWFIPTNNVLHRKLTYGTVSGFYYHSTEDQKVWLKLCTDNSYQTSKMASDDVAALRLKFVQLGKPDLATVQAHCEKENKKICGPLFYEFVKQPNCPPIISQSIGYTCYSPDSLDRDIKSPAFYLHPPIDDSGNVPTNCLENDLSCIENRITNVRSDAQLPPNHVRYCHEFARLVFPTKLVPVTSDTVHSQQSRPSQKAGYSQWQGRMHEDDYVVKSFQKLESYPEPKPPRNISTLPPNIRHLYSQYTIAMADQLKAHSWYAFGKTPKELADCVHSLGQYSELIPTDYSKFDGTHSQALIDLETICIKQAFDEQDVDHVLDLFRTQHNIKGITKNGAKYDVGTSRLSGSPETSLFNTLCNAYIAYICLRKRHKPKVAFSMLGLYGGDDGLSHSISLKNYETTATLYGLQLKAESKKTDEPIVFLGRLYPNCQISNKSLYEPSRFLPRCHIGLDKTLSVEQNAVNRANGYSLTDPTSPVISNWCRYIKRGTTLSPMPWDKNVDSWFSQYAMDVQFPCVNIDDPDALTATAESLDVSIETVSLLMEWFDNHNFKDGVYPPPWFEKKLPKFDCIMNGEIWSGPELNHNDKESKEKSTEPKPRQTSCNYETQSRSSVESRRKHDHLKGGTKPSPQKRKSACERSKA